MTRKKRDRPDPKHFVQVNQRPSLGIELTTGRPWVGVDQQVGHGSADALFALTDEHYASEIAGEPVGGSYVMECWRGDHDDQLLFHPGGGSWRPEHWYPSRTRRLPDPCRGEIWWHIDALGEPADSEGVEISRRLAADTAQTETDTEGVLSMTFALAGDGAYPRPAALIGGLTASSSRERARAILGDPVDAATDTFQIEGFPVRLGFVDDGLVDVVLSRTPPVPLPGGQIDLLLGALGKPEQSPAFRAVARLSDGTYRRWAASSGFGRRLIVFGGGVEMQVQDDQVLSVRVNLSAEGGDSTSRHLPDLVPGLTWPASREDLRRALGGPVASSGHSDLYRYGQRDLVVEHGWKDGSPSSITAALADVTVAHRFNRWRSGDFTTFLDVLGREASNDLVAHVQDLPGVRVRLRSGRVTAVEIGPHKHQADRFPAFVDGMPAAPTRKDIPLGMPGFFNEQRDFLWDFERGWIHAHSRDGATIASITVCEEPPHGLELQRRRYGQDI